MENHLSREDALSQVFTVHFWRECSTTAPRDICCAECSIIHMCEPNLLWCTPAVIGILTGQLWSPPPRLRLKKITDGGKVIDGSTGG